MTSFRSIFIGLLVKLNHQQCVPSRLANNVLTNLCVATCFLLYLYTRTVPRVFQYITESDENEVQKRSFGGDAAQRATQDIVAALKRVLADRRLHTDYQVRLRLSSQSHPTDGCRQTSALRTHQAPSREEKRPDTKRLQTSPWSQSSSPISPVFSARRIVRKHRAP